MKLPFSKNKDVDPVSDQEDGSEIASPANGRKKKKRFKFRISIRNLFHRKRPEDAEPSEAIDSDADVMMEQGEAAPPPAEPKPKKPKKIKKKKEKPKKDKQNKGKKKKPVGLIILLVVVVVAAVVVAIVLFGGSTIEELLEKAAGYQADEKYEKADKIYNDILDEDPSIEEAYLGLCDSYLARDDLDGAIQILEQGYEATSSERIQQRLIEISPEPTPAEGEPPAADAVEPIVWQDAEMERLVRMALGLSDSAAITTADVQGITTLKIVGGTHAAANEPINALNSTAGYTIDGQLYTERGGIRTLDDLSHFKDLKKLTVCYQQITDIGGIAELTGLETVGLYFNEITDISALSTLPNLRYLYVYNNNISDIGPLSGLKALRSLFAQNNSIADLAPISGLTNLSEVYLNNNSIQNIEPIANLKALNFFYAENNGISDISVLSGLTGLTDVSFTGNPVSDYSPASHIRNVNRN